MTDDSNENWKRYLARLIEVEGISIRVVADKIGCSEATLFRLLSEKSVPTEKFLNHVAILLTIGFDKYSRLSNSEKERISETIGLAGGIGIGLGAVGTVISGLGIAGLSGAGITSGLAALGIGGGMIAGVAVAAVIPLAVGAVGFGGVWLAKMGLNELRLSQTQVDSTWETMD